MPKTETEIKPEVTYDINEIRQKTKIDLMLPLPTNSDADIDMYEYVTINGKTTQIKCGEPVSVSWPVFEALMNTGKYDPKQIVI